KNERPLFETKASVDDNGLDSYTSYDAQSGNYYLWLVQRGMFDYNLKIDLSGLDIAAGVPVTAETVSGSSYGEVTNLLMLPQNNIFDFKLSPQSVVLLTIPREKLKQQVISAFAAATVTGGKYAGINNSLKNELTVQLDAAEPNKNNVTYIGFNNANGELNNPKKVLLKVNGYTDKTGNLYRLHVYGIPSEKWDEQKLNWNNAPLLDKNEALINEVGQKAFVAGELAFTNQQQDHMLDVTDLVKKHAGNGITFVLVRETRQLGDDEDKGKKVMIGSLETNHKPELIFWNRN
ncbi:MAG: DNRLRE domain-containing protein, partial [Chitinophagaceae bacterium]